MASRLMLRAIPASASTQAPPSSGPRWRRVSAMRNEISLRTSDELRELDSRKPATPHIQDSVGLRVITGRAAGAAIGSGTRNLAVPVALQPFPWPEVSHRRASALAEAA